MTQTMTIGLDLARRTPHRAVLIGPDGRRVGKPRSVTTSASSLDALIETAGGPGTVVLEPTGTVWLAVCAWLIHRGCTVHRVDTRGAHEFRKFTSRNVKSDSADAEALARMPAANPDAMRPLVLHSADSHGLDRLTRLRAQIVDDRTRLVNRLLASVETYAPTYVPVLGKGLSAEKRFLVRHFIDPRKAAEAGRQGIVTAALTAEPAARVSVKLVDAWVQAATEMRELVVPLGDELPWSYAVAQIEIETHLDGIEHIDARVAALERQIAELYRRVDPDSTLVDLPGIGPVIAPLVMAVVGDVLRFPRAKQFVSFCGMAPRKNQTGLADRKGQPISKSGNRRLRHYLFLAAETGRRTDPQLAAIYARHTGRGAHHTEALVVVGAALARRIYAVLRRQAEGMLAAGPAYVFRTEEGQPMTKQAASRYTRQRYPSKAALRRAAAEAKGGARASSARKEGQLNGSPTGVSDTRLQHAQ
jgi:transposase